MFVPDYNKPDAPGIHMGFGNTVSIYHMVEEEDTFDAAAQGVFDLLKEAQRSFPDWPRVFFVDIAGHDGEARGYSPEFYEFQQEFLFSVVAPFVSAFETPLTGGLVNPDGQRNDLPDRLNIKGDERPNGGRVVPDAAR